MKRIVFLVGAICVALVGLFVFKQTQAEVKPVALLAPTTPSESLFNPAIDMESYLIASDEAAAHRASRRLSEEAFIKMSQEPGTIILDARSKQKYDELHIKGAINLSFPDITIESLKQTFPDPNTRILIYCNNNFEGAEVPFPSKAAIASLNISTYITLYNYGYRNIYELGPLIDIQDSILDFEGTLRTVLLQNK